MKESEIKKAVAKTKAGITKEQAETLKSVGRLRVTDLPNISQYIPADPTKPMWSWVWNKGNGTLVLGDLGMNISSKEIVYLPKFFSVDKINSSIGLRNAIFLFKSLVPIEDPTVLSEEDLEPTPPLVKTLGKGEHDADDVLPNPNPMITGLIDYEEKEKKAQEDLISSVKVGKERIKGSKRNKPPTE